MHCANAVGSRPATKPKLRRAERRQLCVPRCPRFMLRMVQKLAHLSREVHGRRLDQKQKRGEIRTLDLTLTPKDGYTDGAKFGS